jgi:hydrogenase-4 component E
MPMIVEVGIFFDVLVGGVVLAILVHQIRDTFDSMDVSRLTRLKG